MRKIAQFIAVIFLLMSLAGCAGSVAPNEGDTQSTETPTETVPGTTEQGSEPQPLQASRIATIVDRELTNNIYWLCEVFAEHYEDSDLGVDSSNIQNLVNLPTYYWEKSNFVYAQNPHSSSESLVSVYHWKSVDGERLSYYPICKFSNGTSCNYEIIEASFEDERHVMVKIFARRDKVLITINGNDGEAITALILLSFP